MVDDWSDGEEEDTEHTYDNFTCMHITSHYNLLPTARRGPWYISAIFLLRYEMVLKHSKIIFGKYFQSEVRILGPKQCSAQFFSHQSKQTSASMHSHFNEAGKLTNFTGCMSRVYIMKLEHNNLSSAAIFVRIRFNLKATNSIIISNLTDAVQYLFVKLSALMTFQSLKKRKLLSITRKKLGSVKTSYAVELPTYLIIHKTSVYHHVLFCTVVLHDYLCTVPLPAL
ncbi:hypothetical protein EGR_10704 [Echinococcus granulosus]|uniref:Uncharacterized protein n=1 Tax=Echinococcus granulosus TaxID=6210 RepID=W6U1P6_ECHGR|nr:hypothetical protein EGR_10704 [Echinococcus granulosus]EUB54441.1 hypothetical protein EGR_10704 [Echinococcus granulosus]